MDARPVAGRRRHLVAGLVTAAATLAASGILLGLAPAAHATASDNAIALSHLNALRESHGLPPLVESSDLMAIAAQHSAAMAKSEGIYHNPDLASEVSNWEVLGENVGMGGTVEAIDTAFDHSPEHYANEVSTAYTQVGIGTASDSRGYLYITLDFRKPEYATTTPTKTTTAPKPKPVAVATTPLRKSTGPSAAERSATARLAAIRAAAQKKAAERAAEAARVRAQQARVVAVRASAAEEAAGVGSDPVARALAFSRTFTALAG